MALEINEEWGDYRDANPVILPDVALTRLTDPFIHKTSSGGTLVVSGETLDLTPDDGSGGRAYIDMAHTFLANRTYLIQVRLTNFVSVGGNPSSTPFIKLSTSSNIIDGADRINITSGTSVDALYCLAVRFSVETATNVRIGLGLSGNIFDYAGTISDFNIFGLDDFIEDGGAIPPPVPQLTAGIDLSDGFPIVAAFATEWASTYVASTGVVTEISQTVPLGGYKERYRVGLYVSDSFGNQAGEWPDELATVHGYALRGGAWASQNMTYFLVRAADVFSQDSLFSTGDAVPDFAICQSSLNSAGDGHTSAQMLSDMTGLINAAKANNLKVFVPNCTQFGGSGGMSGAQGAVIDEYNLALPALCTSLDAIHIDVWSKVRDPDNPDQLLPAYTSDGIHPNSAGVIPYYTLINDTIDMVRSLLTRPLTSDLTSNITGSITG